MCEGVEEAGDGARRLGRWLAWHEGVLVRKNLLGELGEHQGDSGNVLVGLVQRGELYRKLAVSNGGRLRRSFDDGALRRVPRMRKEPGVYRSLYRG